MPCRRHSSASFAPASYSLTISMICSSVNRLVRICPPPERRSNRFSLFVAPFQGAGSVSLYEYVFGALLGAELTQKQGVIFRYLARLMMVVPGANLQTLMDFMEEP